MDDVQGIVREVMKDGWKLAMEDEKLKKKKDDNIVSIKVRVDMSFLDALKMRLMGLKVLGEFNEKMDTLITVLLTNGNKLERLIDAVKLADRNVIRLEEEVVKQTEEIIKGMHQINENLVHTNEILQNTNKALDKTNELLKED